MRKEWGRGNGAEGLRRTACRSWSISSYLSSSFPSSSLPGSMPARSVPGGVWHRAGLAVHAHEGGCRPCSLPSWVPPSPLPLASSSPERCIRSHAFTLRASLLPLPEAHPRRCSGLASRAWLCRSRRQARPQERGMLNPFLWEWTLFAAPHRPSLTRSTAQMVSEPCGVLQCSFQLQPALFAYLQGLGAHFVWIHTGIGRSYLQPGISSGPFPGHIK